MKALKSTVPNFFGQFSQCSFSYLAHSGLFRANPFGKSMRTPPKKEVVVAPADSSPPPFHSETAVVVRGSNFMHGREEGTDFAVRRLAEKSPQLAYGTREILSEGNIVGWALEYLYSFYGQCCVGPYPYQLLRRQILGKSHLNAKILSTYCRHGQTIGCVRHTLNTPPSMPHRVYPERTQQSRKPTSEGSISSERWEEERKSL